jgi:hypothetical protein
VGGWPPTEGRAGDESDGHWHGYTRRTDINKLIESVSFILEIRLFFL